VRGTEGNRYYVGRTNDAGGGKLRHVVAGCRGGGGEARDKHAQRAARLVRGVRVMVVRDQKRLGDEEREREHGGEGGPALVSVQESPAHCSTSHFRVDSLRLTQIGLQ
jgi:hypothetical protein